jgi:transposase
MAKPLPTRCPRCAELEARLAELEAQVAALRKNSSNSSKPPSSDIVKPSPASRVGGRTKRKRGAQPGHPRHLRAAIPPEEVDQTWNYSLDACPDCGGALEASDAAPRVIQQVEIVERPIRVEEHRGQPHWCPQCQKLHYAPLPAGVRGAGLSGPRLTALVGYLKGACHASFSTIRKLLRDVLGLSVSRGQLAKLVQKVSASLEASYAQLRTSLPTEGRLNVDETGHPDSGARLWTWCFRAPAYTLFRIDASRGSEVLLDVLGQEFDGLLGCDYFSAYRKYMRLNDQVAVQFCLAHFIRDVKFLVEHPRPANRRYGELLLGHLRKLFGAIHRRAKFATEASFRKALTSIRNALIANSIAQLPNTREAANLADRFVEHGESYFRFITEPTIDPTNNVAEQAIRFVAIHRRVTQGTRGPRGQRWCERMWTALATCAQQGRSAFEFVHQTVRAWLLAEPTPSLLPNTS